MTIIVVKIFSKVYFYHKNLNLVLTITKFKKFILENEPFSHLLGPVIWQE